MKQAPQTIQEYQQAFDSYYQPLCNFAYQYVKDWDEAEDVVQAVFINLWKKRNQLEIRTKLSSYLFTATKNNALMTLRRQQYKSNYVEHIQQNAVGSYQDNNIDEEAEQLLLKEKILTAIQTLPPKCQQIFKLSKLSGLTYKEIADDMSISVKTVENQMSKALKILRTQLKNIFYILFFFLLLAEVLFAQGDNLLTRKVKIQIKKGSVQQILDLVSQQANVPIAYSSNQISLQKQVELTGEEDTLGEYLEQIAVFIPIRILERKHKILLTPQRKKKKRSFNPKSIGDKLQAAPARNYTLSGYIKDSESGEALIGATIYEPQSKQGTSTNVYGFYSLTLPAKTHELMVSYVGYTSGNLEIYLKQNIQQNAYLKLNPALEEVVVKASESEQIQELDQMSSNKLYSKKIKELPVLMGEADVIKSVQLLPGVQSVNENASGLYVRGGGPDQNLILMDGVTIYDSNHLFGFVSIFNGDAINSVELIKGGFPARYGGRLSSILDVRLKDGNNQEHHGGVTLGLFSLKGTVEGPIDKDGSSFHISGRTSWTNNSLARTLVGTDESTHLDYGFYDVHAKINHHFSPKSSLFLSAYIGEDQFYTEASPHIEVEDSKGYHHQMLPFWKTDLNWGNKLAVLRWNKIMNSQLFANFSLNYSDYNYAFSNHSTFNMLNYHDSDPNNETGLKAVSDIVDWSLKADFDFYPETKHHLKWGIGYTNHTFTPGIARFRGDDDQGFEFTQEVGLNDLPAHDYYAYIEDNIQLGELLTLNAGVHFAGFVSNDTHYSSPQPRLSMRHLVGENSALKASFGRMTQFIHLVSTPWLGMPTDLWIPSSNALRPKHANQFAVGYVSRLPHFFDISIEAYHKRFENLLEFEHDPNLWMKEELPNWEQVLEAGTGRAYGLEFLLERKIGTTTGWIAYTISKTEREFESLNNGESFPYQYDRLHDISIALSQQLSPKLSLACVWVFATGNVTTLPLDESVEELAINSSSKTTTPEEETFDNSLQRNNYRLPPYHRLDISLNWEHSFLKSKTVKGTLKAGFYNLYNRKNPSFFNQFESRNSEGNSAEESRILGLYEVNLLPVLPFITYGVEF
ncbi:MAG: RNA polymerase sigma-70 factor [Chitinophagales bacterium]